MTTAQSSPSESMCADDALKISQVIRQIYHYTQGETTSDFGHHALHQLAQLINFNSACWLILSGNQPATITTQFTSGLNKSELSKINSSSINELLQQTKIKAGDYLITKQNNTAQQMLAFTQHDNTRHLLILNSKTFSAAQLYILRFIMPLLTNAFAHHIQNKLTRHWNNWRSDKAICDQYGHIIASQTGFITTLANNLPDWDQQRLPTQFEWSQLPIKFEYGKIIVEVFADDDLIIAEAYQFDRLIESLSQAEIKIAQLLLQGKTNKEMAQTLELKEKTIEHQLKSLCTKLDVSNRTEALMILQTSDYRFKNQTDLNI